MSRREIGGQGDMVDFKTLRAGDLVAEGVWVGTRKGKFGPIFEIYNEQTEESLMVPGSGQLKYKMQEFVKLGQFVEIEYDGREKMREGTYRGADVHCFKVFVDDDYVPTSGVGKAAVGKDNDDSVFEKSDEPEPRRESREPRRDGREPRREERREAREPNPARARRPAPVDDFDEDDDGDLL